MHWLKFFREPSPYAPHKRGRGIPLTVNPQAAENSAPKPAILTQAQRDARNKEMRRLAAEGVPLLEIARRYELHPSTVGRVVRLPRI